MIWIGSGNCDYHCLADGVCEVTYIGRDVSRYESIKVISNSLWYLIATVVALHLTHVSKSFSLWVVVSN